MNSCSLELRGQLIGEAVDLALQAGGDIARLALATRCWIDRLRVMESVRLKQSLWIQRGEKRYALILVTALGVAAAIAAVLGFASRRLSARADRRFSFPDVHVGMRFGAAYGGGVTAEIKANAAAQ